MRKLFSGLTSLLLIYSTASSNLAYGQYGNLTINKDQIISIYDGDTLSINVPAWTPIIGEHIGIRIVGIDTPEIHGACPEEIALAKKAKDFLRNSIVSAKKIELKNMDRDKYFRIDAELWIDDKNIGDALINANLAHVYAGGTKIKWCKTEK